MVMEDELRHITNTMATPIYMYVCYRTKEPMTLKYCIMYATFESIIVCLHDDLWRILTYYTPMLNLDYGFRMEKLYLYHIQIKYCKNMKIDCGFLLTSKVLPLPWDYKQVFKCIPDIR